MDLGSILILGSILFFAVLLTVGPILELRGKILFEKQNKAPVLKGRFGMGLMIFSFLLFVVSLVFRSVLSSDVVTPLVISGYGLWFVGGIIAVIRNETLAFMISEEDQDK